jgi:hypothetical protein
MRAMVTRNKVEGPGVARVKLFGKSQTAPQGCWCNSLGHRHRTRIVIIISKPCQGVIKYSAPSGLAE